MGDLLRKLRACVEVGRTVVIHFRAWRARGCGQIIPTTRFNEKLVEQV